MRVSVVNGLQEDFFEAKYTSLITNTVSSNASVGIGYDVTNAASGVLQPATSVSANFAGPMGQFSAQMLGFHFFQAVEICTLNTGINTFYGDAGASTTTQSGLNYQGLF